MPDRNVRHNLRSSLAPAAAWYRRLSGWGKFDLFGAAFAWAAAIAIGVDWTLNDGTLTGKQPTLVFGSTGLAVGAGWWLVERIRQPEDDRRGEPEPAKKWQVYSLVTVWLFVPLILAGVGGWVAFELTAGADTDNRRFWSGLTFVCVFMVGDLVPAVWLVVRARRADRAAEKIVARVASMKSDRRR